MGRNNKQKKSSEPEKRLQLKLTLLNNNTNGMCLNQLLTFIELETFPQTWTCFNNALCEHKCLCD